MNKLLPFLLILLTFGCAFESTPITEDDSDMKQYPKARPDMLAPIVANIIPKNGAWSGDNQLGYQAKYGPDQRQTQTILKLDEWGPPEIWTISLYILNGLKTFDGFGLKARIDFGAGGSTQVVEIDWANGAQISLPMNAVNVQAIWHDTITAEGAGLQVGVQLSRGTRGGTLPPRLTLEKHLDIPGAGSTTILPLPAFAKTMWFSPTQPDSAGLALVYSANVIMSLYEGNTGGALISSAADGVQMKAGVGCPVIGDARYYAIRNQGASPFALAIYADIDG